jgi:L,D-transpeptidase ErfK/SrfK
MWRIAFILLAVVAACGPLERAIPHIPHLTGPTFDEASFARKSLPTFTIPAPRPGHPADTVVGAVGTYRIRQGDTLIDIARYYDLGYNEIVEANPGVDPWVPQVGATITLPTAWVLPCCNYQGIVVNIPEMRLYHYAPAGGDKLVVHTYPVGLGRDDWRTPRGRFKIAGKTVNPQWNIPESIRQEHIRERGDARHFIRGGAPDNPLGRYRLELVHALYSIHGTDIPWGVGMLVSHGCVRLYPEDVEQLFPLVAVGSPVEFTYQPVKLGTRKGTTYVEVHRDIYRYARSLYTNAIGVARRQGLDGAVDRTLLRAATQDAVGVPVPVSSDHSGGRQASALAP